MTLLKRIEAHLNTHVAAFGGDDFSDDLLKEAAERIKTTNAAIEEVRIIGNNKTFDDARKLFCISSVLGLLQALNGDKE